MRMVHGIRLKGFDRCTSARFICRPTDQKSQKMKDPVVELWSGTKARGKVLYATNKPNKPVYTYLGLPFAEPPVGNLRFKPPQPLKLWDGVRNATEFGPVCPQSMEATRTAFPRYPFADNMSEDCLYLNVFSPVQQDPDRKRRHDLPVMVWIHGGGFLLGSSDIYDGRALVANHDVIVVTINYRLGIFGFLTTPDGHIAGNMGLLDQVEALRWIQRYIHCFGGDPDNVTLFGESAGGISIALHMVSPLAKGLFKRAICESGTALYPSVVWSKRNAEKFLKGCLKPHDFKGSLNNGKDVEAFLNTMSTEELTQNFTSKTFGRVIDGHYLPAHPVDLYKSGHFNHVDLMCGCNTHEGMLFINMFVGPSAVRTREEAAFFIRQSLKLVHFRGHARADEICQLVCDEYLRDCSDDDLEDLLERCTAVHADCQFTSPTILTALLHSERANTYVYEFRHRPFFSNLPKWALSDHTDEIPYVFGEPFVTSRTSWPEEDKVVSSKLMTYWTNFARCGNPNGHNVPEWPKFSRNGEEYLCLSLKPKTSHHFKPNKMSFWNQQILGLAHSPATPQL